MNFNGGVQMSLKRGNAEDELTDLIDKMVEDLSCTRAIPSIHRVGDRLRGINKKAYNPMTVAIGPIHRDKAHLKKMDHRKKKYLKLFLDSMGESSVDRYVREIRLLEERARECYADDILIGLGKDDFVLMLLLDGIFILEFFRRFNELMARRMAGEEADDTIFQFDNVIGYVVNDLVLFENQIPFFVLEKLLELTKTRDTREIADLFWPLLVSTNLENNLLQDCSNYNPPHLLGLVHYAECLQFSPKLYDITYEMKNINSATELKEAGIIFKKRNDIEGAGLLDVKFDKKTIYLPVLQIDDSTESKFINLIAYEQYLPIMNQKKFTDYMLFMHYLIHDQRDAKLLRRCGVINTYTGGDEMVYRLIKQIGKNVQPSYMFSYNDVFEGVNRHCTNRKNRWMAVLRRDYFDSPWKVISLLAGFVLLGVAIVQMVFAILSYYQDPKKHK